MTAFQAEGCGGGFAANFIMPPAAVTSTSSIIIRITTVHPFATSWPSSPKGDARSVTGLAVCVIWHDTHSGDWLTAFTTKGENAEMVHEIYDSLFFSSDPSFPLEGNASKRQRVYKAERRFDTPSRS